MSSYTGISPKGPVDYRGPTVYTSSIVNRNREPTGADYRQPETGKLYPTGSFWLVGKDPTTGTFGDLWYLSKIVANVAYWRPFDNSIDTLPTVGITNLGFTYDAGTFTVTGADGSALSTANPAYVTLQSTTSPGLLKTVSVTANQSFIDDLGASQIIGNLFGLNTGVAAAVDIPFFLYAVINDAEDSIAFMISRFPGAVVAPVAGKIADSTTTIASTQGSFFSLANITAADYASNPCLMIGSFRMQMSALNDWTVQTLNSKDGINHFQEEVQFSFPRGQFGTPAGKFFKDNGGTAPGATGGAYGYFITARTSQCTIRIAIDSIDIPGVGAVTAQLALAYSRLEGATCGSGWFQAGGTYSSQTLTGSPNTNVLSIIFINDGGTGFMNNATYTAAASSALNAQFYIENA